ncbi:hypothetical protein CK203_005375 [Vitis vinifera]|uniref:Reverse transcriptase domain-containing protein n=1 Tax=Vitis vinifera TaxID=29760 RepID=A0A438KE51_VITVI|nr:hypothetical protein CK203_005375 [Vitis vinifera]
MTSMKENAEQRNLLRAPFQSKGNEKMAILAEGENEAEKWLNFEGYCGMTEVEIFKVSSHHFSQPSLPFHFPFSGVAPPYPSPSALNLSISDDFGAYRLGSVGIPNRDDEVPQLARLNLLSESFNYDKTKPSSPHGAPILGVFKVKEQNCHRHLSSVGVGLEPIVLDTNPFKWGPTPFRFENMWLQHHSFKECFSSWWREFEGNGWEGHKFMRKLQFVKAKLKDWNKNTFGMLKERKKTILDEIANIDANEQEGALSSDLAVQRAVRKGELEEIILREEIHWRQKAKVKWVKDGDCNSKLFHKVANGDETGISSNSWRMKEVWCWTIPRASQRRYYFISKSSTRVLLLDRDKASGPDGFTIAVFQDCWDVIKDDLVRVFAEFHNSGIINQNTNASFIVLLPKKILIANEIVDEKRRSGEEGVVFKIDFEKAYDHVKWDFLDHVLENKGFSSKWRSWMRDVLSRMLLKVEERSFLESFRVGRNRCRVSHLQFTDDTILFASSSEEELQTLKCLLLVFGQVSGLKVNLDKSNLLASTLIRIISLDSCFMAAKVERMQRDFLWSGVGEGKRYHLGLCLACGTQEGKYHDLLQLRRPHKAFSPDISSQDGLGSSEKHFRHDVHQL